MCVPPNTARGHPSNGDTPTHPLSTPFPRGRVHPEPGKPPPPTPATPRHPPGVTPPPPSPSGCCHPAEHPAGSASPVPPHHTLLGGSPSTVPPRPTADCGWATGEGALTEAVLLSSCSEGVDRPRTEKSGTLPGRFGVLRPPGEARRYGRKGMPPVRGGSPGPGSRSPAGSRGPGGERRKDGVSCGGVGDVPAGTPGSTEGAAGVVEGEPQELGGARPCGNRWSWGRPPHRLSPVAGDSVSATRGLAAPGKLPSRGSFLLPRWWPSVPTRRSPAAAPSPVTPVTPRGCPAGRGPRHRTAASLAQGHPAGWVAERGRQPVPAGGNAAGLPFPPDAGGPHPLFPLQTSHLSPAVSPALSPCPHRLSPLALGGPPPATYATAGGAGWAARLKGKA